MVLKNLKNRSIHGDRDTPPPSPSQMQHLLRPLWTLNSSWDLNQYVVLNTSISGFSLKMKNHKLKFRVSAYYVRSRIAATWFCLTFIAVQNKNDFFKTVFRAILTFFPGGAQIGAVRIVWFFPTSQVSQEGLPPCGRLRGAAPLGPPP